jgi:hypothetical protein
MLGDVGDHRQRSIKLSSILGNRVCRHPDPQFRTITSPEPFLKLFAQSVLSALQDLPFLLDILGKVEIQYTPPNHFFPFVSQHPRQLPIHIRSVKLRIEEPHSFVCGLNDPAIAFFAFLDCVFSQLSARKVN